MLIGKHVTLNLAAVMAVLASAGLQGDEALWMLKKLKTINRIINHGH